MPTFFICFEVLNFSFKKRFDFVYKRALLWYDSRKYKEPASMLEETHREFVFGGSELII